MSESPPENEAPCGSSSELDFPAISPSEATPFGTLEIQERITLDTN